MAAGNIIRNSVNSCVRYSNEHFRFFYGRDPILPIDDSLLYPQSSSSVAQAEADRAITHVADHIRAASNMARYHSRMNEHFNASCYALQRMRPLSISWAECSVVISCGKVDYDKYG
jgi:hypothetical protein